MNPFESGIRKVIPAVLVYGRLEDRVLMIHRHPYLNQSGDLDQAPNQNGDFHHGKWNGLGGKCELNESPLDAACREFQEESGVVVPPERFRSLGVLQFPNFKPHKQEDWIVFIFTVQLSVSDLTPALGSVFLTLSEPSTSSPGVVVSNEGTLHWIAAQDLQSLNLWPGDRHFIPYILRSEPFVGTIWYDHLEVSKHWIQSLGLTTD